MNLSELRKSQIIAFIFILLGVAISVALTITNADAFKILAVFAVLVVAPLFALRPYLGFLVLLVARPVIDALGQQVSFNIQDIVTLDLGAIIGVIFVVWGVLYLAYKRVKLYKIPVVYPLIILSLLSLVSILGSDFKVVVFGEWIRVTSYVLALLLGYHFTTTLHAFRSLTNAVIVSSVIPVVLAVYQIITHTGISDEASSNRIYATFAHPALFGQYLALLMLLLLIAILLYKRYALMYSTLFFVLGCILLFTFSRGAWLFAAFGVAILAITFYRSHFVKIFLIGLLGVFAIAAVGLLLQSYTSFKPIDASLLTRISQTTQINPDNSIVWRFQFWKESVSAGRSFLVRGYGAGTFIDFAEREIDSSFEAHNDYLKLGIEIGALGSVMLITFFVSLLAFGVSSFRKSVNQNEKLLAMFIVAEVLGMIFISFFDNLYQNTTFYWLALALFGGAFHLLQKQHQKN